MKGGGEIMMTMEADQNKWRGKYSEVRHAMQGGRKRIALDR